MNPDTSPGFSPLSLVRRIAPIVLVLAIMAGGWLAVEQLDTGQGETVLEPAGGEATDQPVLELPSAKIAAGGIRANVVEQQQIQHVHVLPGRLQYDEARHINMKAPTDGIMTECLVKPGDRVDAGQLLAVINSPEVGKARADVLEVEANYAVVSREATWQQQVTNNLTRLFADLESGQTIQQLETRYADEPLGEYRDQLLAAWSSKLLADQMVASAKPLAEQGSIAVKTWQQREADRQVAEAAFQTVKDKARFESKQQRDRLQNQLIDLERRVKIARQHLETLLGYSEDECPTDASAALSRMEVRAPFAGTIESRTFAQSERVSQNDSLFVLADTRSLYVAAVIREDDWPAVQLQAGQQLTVTAPAITGETFNALVHYVGRQVDLSSNSVPLVATISNEQGLLRPGMFVRVSVPMNAPREAIAVRPQAVMQHDNEQFVFVAMNDRTFQKVDIVTGQASKDWVEVESGLQPGQRVVDEGAFLLKSELLLEGEEE